MNLREDEAPVIARGKDGRLGVVIIDTETKKPVKPWTAVDDLTPERREILRPYQQPGGRNNYRLDPDLFKKIEALKKDPNPKLSPIIQQSLKPKPKPDPNQISPIFQRPTTTTTTTTTRTPEPRTPEPEPKPRTPEPEPKPQPLTADQKSNLEYQKLREKDPEAAKKLGMQIWAKKYSTDKGQSKFTVPSVEKGGSRIDVATARQKEIISAVRGNRPIPPVTPVTKTKVDTAPAGTPPVGMTLSRQYQGNDTPGRLGQLETGYAGKPVKQKPNNEAYDVVLDYLLSEGHAETVEEAHYVMMQMDAEYIQSIVEAGLPIPPGGIKPDRLNPIDPVTGK